MRVFCVSFFLLISVLKLNAQPDRSPNVTLSDSMDSIKENLFNGIEHLGYSPAIEGNAYFKSGEWQIGSIMYKNALYPNVFLKYDLLKNQAVVRHFNGFTGIELYSPRVQSFTIEHHNFIYLSDSNKVNAGFYEILKAGKVSLLARRFKKLQENINSGRLEQRFIQKDLYYVKKGGEYYPIKNDKTLLNILKEKKAEMKSYMKAGAVRYKDDPESVLIKIVEYYNQLQD
jgi:hypothetical protein